MRFTLLVAIISVTSAWRRLLVEDDGSQLSFKEAWKKFHHDFGVHEKENPSHSGLKKHVKKEVKAMRKENFRKVFNMVREHNKKYRRGEVSYDLAINEFADLTFDEMSSMTGDEGSEPEKKKSSDGHRRMEFALGDLDEDENDAFNNEVDMVSQDEVDMVKVGGSYVNWHTSAAPIRQQGGCGSCWAFASASMIENRLYYARGWNEVSLSHQEMVDCVVQYGSTTCDLGKHVGGCCGSHSYRATSYVANHGIASGGEIKYINGETGKCTRDSSKNGGLAPGMIKAQSRMASGEKDLEEVVRGGAVGVAFIVYADFFLYNSGVYDPNYQSKEGGHAVVLLGFKDDYWILQNSWGKNWGENGLFRMKKGHNAAGIGTRGRWSWISVPSYKTLPQAPTGGGARCGTVKNYGETGPCNTKCAKGTSQVCKWHSGCGWRKDCYRYGDHWKQRNSKLCRDSNNGYLFAQEECCQCLHFDPRSKLSTYQDFQSLGPRGDDAKADLSICKGQGYKVVAKIPFSGWDEYFHVDGVKYWSFTQYECDLSRDQANRRLEDAETTNIDDDIWLQLDDPAFDDPTLGGDESRQMIPSFAGASNSTR